MELHPLYQDREYKLVHSELVDFQGSKQVKVYIESSDPRYAGIKKYEIYLPSNVVTVNVGFNALELCDIIKMVNLFCDIVLRQAKKFSSRMGIVR